MSIYSEIEDIKIPFWEEHILWPLERLWEWPGDRLRGLKWFIQRGRNGYADCDVWSLDQYLVDWLPKAIRQLRDESFGCPEHFTNREWKKVLTKMANDIEVGDKILDGVNLKERKKLEKQFGNGMKSLHKYFFNLWN